MRDPASGTAADEFTGAVNLVVALETQTLASSQSAFESPAVRSRIQQPSIEHFHANSFRTSRERNTGKYHPRQTRFAKRVPNYIL